MDFGYFTLSDNYYRNNDRTANQYVRDIVDQAIYAEEVGMSSAWIGEHHFSTLGVLSLPAGRSAASKSDRLDYLCSFTTHPVDNRFGDGGAPREGGGYPPAYWRLPARLHGIAGTASLARRRH